MVKLSRFAKIRENRESFPPWMFWRIQYKLLITDNVVYQEAIYVL